MTDQQAMQQLLPIAKATLAELTATGMQRSCIYAGAVLSRVLQRKGYSQAYPLTVRGFILNPELHAWAEANDYVIDGSTQAKWGALGGRLVDLASGPVTPENEGKWPGHLAVIVPNHFGERHGFLDLTIPQVNQPQWKIVLPSIIAPVRDTFLRGEAEARIPANASLAMYVAHPEDTSYTETPIWKEHAKRDAAVERVVGALG